ncbi:MAG: sulfatase-like hydrolase/transferase [Nitratireductor sp.]
MVNFVFIMTDQHRADYLGCAGHPIVKTPNIDRIAARGMLHDRCYVANPVCMPNRGALMTGRYSSISGIRHNGIPLPLEANTFVDVLRAGGYDTALFGKCHLQPMTDELPELGANPAGKGDLANARKASCSGYDQEKPSAWKSRGVGALRLPYYGFDHLDLLSNHGDETGAAHEIEQRAVLGDLSLVRGSRQSGGARLHMPTGNSNQSARRALLDILDQGQGCSILECA